MSMIEAPRTIAAHQFEREANEHYVEPHWCSERLFVEEKFEGGVWDPCCGFGRIPDSAKAAGHYTIATDLIDRGYRHLTQRLDFLTTDKLFAQNIVCNPPFNIAGQFARKALDLGAVKIAMIFPTARLNAAHWMHQTPLARVLLMTPRPSMPPGWTIAAGQKPGSGKTDYCWLIWTRGRTAPAEMRWLKKVAS